MSDEGLWLLWSMSVLVVKETAATLHLEPCLQTPASLSDHPSRPARASDIAIEMDAALLSVARVMGSVVAV